MRLEAARAPVPGSACVERRPSLDDASHRAVGQGGRNRGSLVALAGRQQHAAPRRRAGVARVRRAAASRRPRRARRAASRARGAPRHRTRAASAPRARRSAGGPGGRSTPAPHPRRARASRPTRNRTTGTQPSRARAARAPRVGRPSQSWRLGESNGLEGEVGAGLQAALARRTARRGCPRPPTHEVVLFAAPRERDAACAGAGTPSAPRPVQSDSHGAEHHEHERAALRERGRGRRRSACRRACRPRAGRASRSPRERARCRLTTA